MTENSVVRARIDEVTKSEAAAVLASMGLSLSDAFRLLLKRVVAEKALPFETLVPNAEAVEAMKAARRGAVTKVGESAALLASLNADSQRHDPLQPDDNREKAGPHRKNLDSLPDRDCEFTGSQCAAAPQSLRSRRDGERIDHRDCHIRHDLVLINRKLGESDLQLVRLGSHSGLGL